jgi:hypothetical protein
MNQITITAYNWLRQHFLNFSNFAPRFLGRECTTISDMGLEVPASNAEEHN